MGKPKGATASTKAVRQRMVCKLFLKGLSTSEVSRQLGVSERTIQRDFEEIKASFQANIERDKIRSWALADAEFQVMWNEAWVLYHRAATEKENDRTAKLAVLDRLLRIKEQRDSLAFFNTQITRTQPHPKSSQTLTEEQVSAIINLSPPDERRKEIENVRNRIGVLEKRP